MTKTRAAEYGDFQTPPALARSVCTLLRQLGDRAAALLEPTCGQGNFLLAGLDHFPEVETALGVEINPQHLKHAETARQRHPAGGKARLIAADFFTTDWPALLAELREPILVLGNLPWVTNAHLGTLGSENLPPKSNFQKRSGLDAITGKANFDISEWMLLRLLETLNGRWGTLAMLCKSSVARKALCQAWKNRVATDRAAIYRIDAAEHFDAAVDAVLLVMRFHPGTFDTQATVFASVQANAETETVIGYEDGTLLADVEAYHRWKHLCGAETIKWRSGIKHDCANVMEFYREGSNYRNGLGEQVDLEDTYLFPMLKSSHVAGARLNGNRYMLVTQRTVGAETSVIERRAPKTWSYLQAHAKRLNRRGSSIYRKRPPFSVFGVGEYSFAPWKVAISGFYKRLGFTVVGPIHNKPVVLDDTSYFLPCQTGPQAEYLAELLNSPIAAEFYRAFTFWDSKRPITADLLRRLDLRRLAQELGSKDKFDTWTEEPDGFLFV